MTRVPYAGDETARHADIPRELIDGRTGDHRRSEPGEAIPGRPES
jgi:hypothetical protein